MASLSVEPDTRNTMASPRTKNRENAKNTPCRNIPIYGFCRYEKDGCAYNHDLSNRSNSRPINPASSNFDAASKFNAESPSFTPLQPHVNGTRRSREYPTISPRSANATPFTPKNTVNEVAISSSYADPKDDLKRVVMGGKEFHPTSYEVDPTLAQDVNDPSLMSAYDAYSLQSAYQGLATQQSAVHNPYLQDPYSNPNYYQTMQSFSAPLQHHLYASLPPHRELLHGYQRITQDFFIPEDLRRHFQKRMEATLQVMPNSRLLPTVEHFHSLVPLDESSTKINPLFDYQTWVYKATSSKDGKTYAIRRIAGFRLTNEHAVRALIPWKRIDNGSMVTIHDVFTTRAFGDSSLLFITDYHPCSETLSEHHQSHPGHRNGHHSKNHGHQHVPEQILWSYIVQIASALKSIHSSGLAARILHPSKILVTSKNRIRLNACGMLDVIKFDSAKVGLPHSFAAEQQDDLVQLGRLIVSLAAGNPSIASNPFQVQQALEGQVSTAYSDHLRECIVWLLTPSKPDQPAKNLDTLLAEISGHAITVLDSVMHAQDAVDDVLATSLEDGRLVRLMLKINMVLERPENDHAGAGTWNSETGERYYVKLFRDYVFHSVDAQGRPSLDLSHVLGCLERLDAGSTEQIQLSSREGDTVFVVSYKDVKRALESAFNEVFGIGSHGHSQPGSGGKGRKA